MSNGLPLEDQRVGLPRNFVRSCLMLLIAEQPSHGYDLMDRLTELGLPRPDPGSLYRTLRALERDHLVTSHWMASSVGPPRRAYALTQDGWDWLHALAGAHAESRRILGRFLDRYAELASRQPAQSERA